MNWFSISTKKGATAELTFTDIISTFDSPPPTEVWSSSPHSSRCESIKKAASHDHIDIHWLFQNDFLTFKGKKR